MNYQTLRSRMRGLLAMLLLASLSPALKAESDETAIGLRAGHNNAFGGFAAVSVETSHTLSGIFSISGGLQYSTIGKASVEACPSFVFQRDWGTLSVETLLSYTSISSINSFAAGAGFGVDSKWAGGKIGYFYRTYGNQHGWINEPFNIFYDFRAHFLNKIDAWTLDFVITNCERFELERHYQPSFILESKYYPTSRLGVALGVGCKPAGVFNISAGYYQSYIKTGLIYRW